MWIAPEDVARILVAIGTEPNRRSKPLPGDLEGPFDYWFDGGAAAMQSMHIRYVFADGITAMRSISPRQLSVTITFPDQKKVTVTQS